MKIEFSTYAYRREYGHDPGGRGMWWFSFEGCYEFSHLGLYRDAKKACREYVKSVAPAGYTGTVIVKVET